MVKRGFLAKPFEVNDLAEKILRLLTDKKLNRKMGQAGRDLVAAKFTKHHHQKKLEEEIKRAKKTLFFNKDSKLNLWARTRNPSKSTPLFSPRINFLLVELIWLLSSRTGILTLIGRKKAS